MLGTPEDAARAWRRGRRARGPTGGTVAPRLTSTRPMHRLWGERRTGRHRPGRPCPNRRRFLDRDAVRGSSGLPTPRALPASRAGRRAVRALRVLHYRRTPSVGRTAS